MAEIKLDWDMESSERLTEEIKASKNNGAIKVGNYILKCFETDEKISKDYKDRKITLDNVWKHVFNRAKIKLGNKSGYIEPATVYGWAKDYIQDIKTKTPESATLILDIKTQQELKEQAKKEFKELEIRKLQKEADQVKKEKEEAEKEHQEKQKAKLSLKKKKESEKIEKIKEQGQISLW